jgi:hypothetical protein
MYFLTLQRKESKKEKKIINIIHKRLLHTQLGH